MYLHKNTQRDCRKVKIKVLNLIAYSFKVIGLVYNAVIDRVKLNLLS